MLALHSDDKQETDEKLLLPPPLLQYRYFTTPALPCLSSLNALNLVDAAHSKLFGLMADGIPIFGPLGEFWEHLPEWWRRQTPHSGTRQGKYKV